MPRMPRDCYVIPDQPNHVILRGNNRRRLFSYVDDRKLFLRMFSRACGEYGCLVHALCMMKNHVHDLTTPLSVEGMSSTVKRFAQRYAQVRNKTKRGTGKLFEQRYKSKPIQDERHLIAATAYIEANPIRAGVVADARDYPWSTYPLHIGEPERSAIPVTLWTPTEWYLSLGRTPTQSAARYREIFDGYVAKPERFGEFGLDEHDELDEESSYRITRPNGSRAAECQTTPGSRVISKR